MFRRVIAWCYLVWRTYMGKKFTFYTGNYNENTLVMCIMTVLNIPKHHRLINVRIY